MIDTARIPDVNGWYTVPRNPISRVGVFQYSAGQINAPDKATNPGRIYNVYRPEEELADPAALASFKLTPWTDEHAMLGDPARDPNLTPAEKKGVHGVIGEQVEYDPTDRTLYANLKVFSEHLAGAIDAGKKELSCGFRCVYDFVSGVFEGQPYDAIQRTIRGNHIATVPHGRMGPGVAVLDHFNFTFDAKELIPMIPNATKKTTRRALHAKALGLTTEQAAGLVIPGMAMDEEVDAPAAEDGPSSSDLAKQIADLVKPIQDIQKSLAAIGAPLSVPAATDEPGDDMEPMLDAAGVAMMDGKGAPMFKKKGAAKDALPAAAMDAAIKPYATRLAAAEATIASFGQDAQFKSFAEQVTARNELAAKLTPFVGTFACDAMTLAEVGKYGADKLGLSVAAGQEVTAVSAYLHNRKAPSADNVFALDDHRTSGSTSAVASHIQKAG